MKNTLHNACWLFAVCVVVACVGCRRDTTSTSSKRDSPDEPSVVLRIATFNASLHRDAAGELQQDLSERTSESAGHVAEIIQRVRPDILLVNELDYDQDGTPAQLLLDNYLRVSQNGQLPMDYSHVYVAPVNTGVPSGRDLDNDGAVDGPADCYGFGRYPGQYGMAVFSRFPIEAFGVRTFQRFLWKDMPGAMQPRLPDAGETYYSTDTWDVLRLSSKSHWDVPVRIGNVQLHFLVAHPTPPVFDGAEDRNGARNHDENRLWADYVSAGNGRYIYDDDGRQGGLAADALFVVAGDLNADLHDGAGRPIAVTQLLNHPRINGGIRPTSLGAVEAAGQQARANLSHRGASELDTAEFADFRFGNLRVDYVLPCRELRVDDAGVYWPASDEDGSALIKVSDHRLVWIDVRL